jgi:hypothetical protein
MGPSIFRAREFAVTMSSLLGLLLASSEMIAAEVLDQQSVFDSAIADSGSSAQEVGETFTVGVDGTMSRIEVLLARAGFSSANGVFRVYSTSGGLPNASLGSAVINSAAVSTTTPTFISFDLNSFNIAARAGDMFAFGISSPDGGLYFLPDSFQSNPYAGGTGVRRTLSAPPGPWSIQTYDYSFKTYVNAASPALLGDYNSNGIVDADDYTVWRDTLAAGGTSLLNDPTPGMVDQSDYTYWTAHFGAAGGGEAAIRPAAVPEPSSIALVISAAFVAAVSSGFSRIPRCHDWAN